jgi:hypothetical protein
LPLPGKYKYIASLNESREQMFTNVELMDLVTYSEEAVGKMNCVDIENKLNA